MVVTLELAPEVEQRIIAQAASHGVSLVTYLNRSARTPSLLTRYSWLSPADWRRRREASLDQYAIALLPRRPHFVRRSCRPRCRKGLASGP
jgi:hypothetical protein